MKIGIYYGGRGIISDPTLYVLKKMTQVFEELNIEVLRYDLYDQKNNITTLPQSLKEVDAIVLGATVEWHGVGGYMNSFLDACWLYGDKERIQNIYMAPVIMSTTYGEKDAELDLIKAWTTLGGQCANGITGYVPDAADFEINKQYDELIEKCAENIYRTCNQRRISLPISTREISRKVGMNRTSRFSQQETEQLSEYISDEKYVNKQKEDIKALAGFFKNKLESSSGGSVIEGYINAFKDNFNPKPGAQVGYKIVFTDSNKTLAIKIDGPSVEVKEGDVAYPGCTLSMSLDILGAITSGRKTFQGGFMDGSIIAKGDFQNIRLMDEVFPFMEEKS
ncbi:MAG: SCP2 sterol-binding domain-containing protein [Lachnospiraceae bacterium]|nr:SCP2 sterol-binding domain-containing protein [Lachnospiraceae bacterium]